MRARAIGRWALVVVVAGTAPAVARAEGIAIEHTPAACVVAEKFIRLEARLDPAERVGRARVHFRGEGGSHWYGVDMEREGGSFRATLPKPRRSLRGVSYYIEVADKSFVESRSPEYAAAVVPEAAGCGKDRPVAGSVKEASVRLGASAGVQGVPPVPSGFAADGIVGAPAQGQSPDRRTLIAAGGAAVVGGVLIASTGGGGGGGGGGSGSGSGEGLTGTWVGSGADGFFMHGTNGNTEQPVVCEENMHMDAVMNLVRSGDTLSGDLTLTAREVTPTTMRPACHEVGDQFMGTINGTVSGATLLMEYHRTGGLSRPANMVASVAGQRMTGTIRIRDRFEAFNGTWTLARR